MAKKYYVVWKGRKTGVFDNWEKCKQSIEGYPGAQYRSFKTYEAALFAYKQDYETIKKDKIWQSQLFNEKPYLNSIAVDAAFSSRTKILEYQGIYLKDNKKIFYKKFSGGTNNIGEFLAIVHALALLKKKNLNLPVYSDSQIAINWVKNKHCKTDYDFSQNIELQEVILRAEKWLNENDISKFKILKWKTDIWGEIPADFGNK